MDDEGGVALLEIKHDDSALKKIAIIFFLEWHGKWNTLLNDLVNKKSLSCVKKMENNLIINYQNETQKI